MKQFLLLLFFFSLTSNAQVGQSADDIIRKVIKAKASNDPQKKLKSFQFNSYSKLIITANPDSINGRIDTIVKRKGRREKIKIDSSDYKFKKLIARQHLFLTEKVSQYQFADEKLKENIIGTKMAGFKQPVYEIIALHLQSFSIYVDKYELVETKYNSPIADDAFRTYHYTLLDATVIDGRKCHEITFEPSRNKKEVGLHGTLYIDAENFAISRAMIRTRGIVDITAIHEYDFIDDQDIWFPHSRTLKITKGDNDEDIKILGETLKFRGENDISPKTASDFTYLLLDAQYFDIHFNIPISVEKAAIAVEIPDEAIDRDNIFWESNRLVPLDPRSTNTYFALDSIVTKERLERRLFVGRKILNGYVPLGFFDADLRYLLSFNNYEGFRIGFGGITNEIFSKKYRIEGYTAYGTKDGNFKYNIGAAARMGKFSNTWIGGSYTDDIREIASTNFAIDKRVFKIYDPRPINVSTFYHYVTWRGYIETKFIPKTESIWQITYSSIEPKFGYAFNLKDQLYQRFHLTAAMVSLQWNPFSDFMQTPVGRLETDKQFPKFTFQFTKSIPDVLDNDFDFGKIDVRAEYQKNFLNGQKSSFLFEAGYACGEVPITHAYNTSPNNLNKDGLIPGITFAGKNSFETMYFNEFFSTRYVFLQFKHALKKIELFRKIRPTPVLVTRMAWGAMDEPQRHLGITYKTLNDGFYESGLELNGIYNGLGLSGFYRYGVNQLPRLEDNISIKISFVINLGF